MVTLAVLFLIALIVVSVENTRLRDRNELLEQEPKVSLMFEYYNMYNGQFVNKFEEYELKRMSTLRHEINNRFKVLCITITRE